MSATLRSFCDRAEKEKNRERGGQACTAVKKVLYLGKKRGRHSVPQKKSGAGDERAGQQMARRQLFRRLLYPRRAGFPSEGADHLLFPRRTGRLRAAACKPCRGEYARRQRAGISHKSRLAVPAVHRLPARPQRAALRERGGESINMIFSLSRARRSAARGMLFAAGYKFVGEKGYARFSFDSAAQR